MSANRAALVAALDRIDERERVRKEKAGASIDPMHLGPNIERYRTEKGWSTSELARRSKVNRSYLWKLETGMFDNPGIRVVLGIARALGVSVVDLLTEAEHANDV